MLSKLSIKNFALIDDVCVDFTSGLTSITGETGAGKSIILGALSLVLGKRADLNSIRNNALKCIIEAEFVLEKSKFLILFNKCELDFDTHTIIRRELLPSGKSRAFVNDTPVTLSQLHSISNHLVDIHSQHETFSLLSEAYQLEILDILAGNLVLSENYSEKLKDYKEVSETILELVYKKESASKELDYNTFLYDELVEANLKNANQDVLEETYSKLNNTEAIQETLKSVNGLLNEEQYGALNILKETRNLLVKLNTVSSDFGNLYERLNCVIIEMDDVSEEMINLSSSIEADPSLLNEINEKLQTIYKLQKKHTVATITQLLEIQTVLEEKIEITNNLDGKIKKLEIFQENLHKTLKALADKIHKKRLSVIPTLKNKLTNTLNDLGMPNATFKFELTSTTIFKNNGTDSLLLLFTANKGHNFGPLNKVASGGELSRIMLSFKAVIAQYKRLPTAIFDEIDSGVSGEIAYKMAEILKEMSLTMQIFVITHLPQLAAVGNQHIKIFKEDVNQITQTKLKTLTKEERITEIAEMIGGKNKSISAINQAKELLN
ncbi:MAG: DNA repair protein RecN [Flavobacteriaceae bacterium]|nr:DNA repair protein RecN [Flavobacteriaceae bacterium]MBT3918952.1 DNA repair protein RecN [Flavobacteriaceae bacterium]MBT6705545.1 DNA repair protein RecN [Flavobacteriaceae bacterium]